ncbi:MAG: hypothetical protein NZM36_06395, partial [Aquificaceae bacterium]|nr:hypothetical protein [Aquificaceae bacterium]
TSVAGAYAPLFEVFEELLEQIKELSKAVSIADADLANIAYETLATEETEIRKLTGKGLKVYTYTQLKGYKDGKSYTLKSWRTEQAPIRLLSELVRLYRGARHLKKAIEYLS